MSNEIGKMDDMVIIRGPKVEFLLPFPQKRMAAAILILYFFCIFSFFCRFLFQP